MLNFLKVTSNYSYIYERMVLQSSSLDRMSYSLLLLVVVVLLLLLLLPYHAVSRSVSSALATVLPYDTGILLISYETKIESTCLS